MIPEDPEDLLDFNCPKCNGWIQTSGAWFDKHDWMACPRCGLNIDLSEVDLDEDVTDFTQEDLLNLESGGMPGIRRYLAPLLHCGNCSRVLELFCSRTPETDRGGLLLLGGADPPETPPAEWTAVFGCLACGHVAEYAGAQVRIEPVLKGTEGIYHSGKGVSRVEFPCADRRCKLPFSMYVDIGRKKPSSLVQLVRSAGFRYRLPCGHDLLPVPEKFYSVHPVMGPMW